MGILAVAADERVVDVSFDQDALSVRLKGGRTISVPLAWYPRPPPSSTTIGRLPEAATASTGQKSTKTSAPRDCSGVPRHPFPESQKKPGAHVEKLHRQRKPARFRSVAVPPRR